MITTHVKKTGPLFDINLTPKVKRAIHKGMKESILLAEREVKLGLVPQKVKGKIGGRKTSHLSRGVRGKVFRWSFAELRPGRVVYGAEVPYSRTVEFGRKSSMQKVKTRGGRALRFKFRGATSYSYRAWTQPFKHPLIGNPMFKKTAEKFRRPASPLKKIFERSLGTALN